MATMPVPADCEAESAGLANVQTPTRRRRGSAHNDQQMDSATADADPAALEGPLTPQRAPLSRSRRASLHGDQLASTSATDTPADNGPGDHTARPANSFRGGKVGGAPLSFNPTFAATRMVINGAGLGSSPAAATPTTVPNGSFIPTTTATTVNPVEARRSRRNQYLVGTVGLLVAIAVAVAYLNSGGGDAGEGDAEPAASLGDPAAAEGQAALLGGESAAAVPTRQPTVHPSQPSPTAHPTARPTTAVPTDGPTASRSPTGSPGTFSPTHAPTTLAPTAGPSTRPTTSPSATPPIILVPGTTTTLLPGPARLAPSGTTQLLRLTRTILASNQTLLAGRAYGGHSWESAPPELVRFSCGNGSDSLAVRQRYLTASATTTNPDCTIRLPNSSAARYQITVFDYANETVSNRSVAARFLMRTTFGPTRRAIDAYLTEHGADPAAWLAAQMASSPTLLRAWWRKRVNPRIQDAAETRAGQVRSACSDMSRWSRFAFNGNDNGSPLEVASAGDGFLRLSVRGEFRTVVPASLFDEVVLDPPELNRSYSTVHQDSPPGTGYAQSRLTSNDAWLAGRLPDNTFAAGQWMQIDLGAVLEVSGVVTMGRKHADWYLARDRWHDSASVSGIWRGTSPSRPRRTGPASAPCPEHSRTSTATSERSAGSPRSRRDSCGF